MNKLLPDYESALALVLEHAPEVGVERVALTDSLGRVLREDVVADRDQPPFERSAMDGFAVSSGIDLTQSHAVQGSIAAGQAMPQSPSGVWRIATGASVPVQFDTVIPIERTEVTSNDDGELVQFTVDSVEQWQHIHRRGSDANTGDVVVRAGTRMGPQHVGIASAVGASDVGVSARPRITLITTGDEVMPPSTPTGDLEPQQIRNSNGPLLRAFFEAIGAPLLEHVHVPDEPEHTRAAAREALSRSHLVVTVGGVSVGQRDFLPWAWQKLGLNTVLHGVAIQPGKPVFVAAPFDSEHAEEKDNKLVIGLPGNPVSVFATAHLFVWPIVRRMMGMDAALPWRSCALGSPVRAKKQRQVFRVARCLESGWVEPIHWHGSGDLMHTADADGWIRLPFQDGEIEAGRTIQFLPMVW